MRRRPQGTTSWRLRIVALAFATAAGCSRWEADLPFVSLDPKLIGTKMLKPGATATTCRFGVIGMDPPKVVEDALRGFRESDPEADALLAVHVQVHGWSIGLVSRQCAAVKADVARATPVVIVPMPDGMHHGSHR